MKLILNVLFLSGLFTGLAHADSVELMRIRKNSGFTPPQYRFSLECVVYDDYVETRILRGRVGEKPEVSHEKTVYTEKVPSLGVAQALLERAARGSIDFRNGPTDGPTSVYVGVLEGEVVSRHVKLLANYSTRVFENKAPGVESLLEFGDANCPWPNHR